MCRPSRWNGPLCWRIARLSTAAALRIVASGSGRAGIRIRSTQRLTSDPTRFRRLALPRSVSGVCSSRSRCPVTALTAPAKPARMAADPCPPSGREQVSSPAMVQPSTSKTSAGNRPVRTPGCQGRTGYGSWSGSASRSSSAQNARWPASRSPVIACRDARAYAPKEPAGGPDGTGRPVESAAWYR
ncbi:hypothetical protein GCM10027615_71060 [Plantactinospora veratri]